MRTEHLLDGSLGVLPWTLQVLLLGFVGVPLRIPKEKRKKWAFFGAY